MHGGTPMELGISWEKCDTFKSTLFRTLTQKYHLIIIFCQVLKCPDKKFNILFDIICNDLMDEWADTMVRET